MSLIDFIFTIILTSLVSNGVYILFSKDELLYFLVKPIYDKKKKIDNWRERKYVDAEQRSKSIEGRIKLFADIRRQYNKKVWFEYLCKPVFMCIKCMGSVWGVITFLVLHGVHIHLVPIMLICCLSAIALNLIVYKMIEDYV